ncbi:radical SAM protein [Microaerobacter geothermalis]|uniref:7-carboxy-7-deazaguanine synthase QueE n=1 Tax=Microaerobacter geothermalis TaxID=674972 RepID=UPI001F16CD25|nr:radical SAM protein [Microaerobacter geothermalis]MCF6093504.1 radical SAM protein [Microaerobacter geothermalis]
MEMTLPMVEIFETVEGEGLKAGYPTTFIRLFHCNLRCKWCDTPYSYSPALPEFYATTREIVEQVTNLGNPYICLTGGEPLIHGGKSMDLIHALSELDIVKDVHIETNGAIDLRPFTQQRKEITTVGSKVRFIMDYKLSGSGEKGKMITNNFSLLQDHDEIKFVVANREDFQEALDIIENHYQQGQILFSPVFSMVSPRDLVEWILKEKAGRHYLKDAKLNLQIHKWIWDPDMRGV